MKLIPTYSIERLNLLKDNSTRHQVLLHLEKNPNFKFRVEYEAVSKNCSTVLSVLINDEPQYFIRVSEDKCIPYIPNAPYSFKDYDGYTVFVYFELVD